MRPSFLLVLLPALCSAGNAKVAALIRSAPKGAKKFYVKVTGEISHNAVKVDSIVRTP